MGEGAGPKVSEFNGEQLKPIVRCFVRSDEAIKQTGMGAGEGWEVWVGVGVKAAMSEKLFDLLGL